jgi:hypothetical protein
MFWIRVRRVAGAGPTKSLNVSTWCWEGAMGAHDARVTSTCHSPCFVYAAFTSIKLRGGAAHHPP